MVSPDVAAWRPIGPGRAGRGSPDSIPFAGVASGDPASPRFLSAAYPASRNCITGDRSPAGGMMATSPRLCSRELGFDELDFAERLREGTSSNDREEAMGSSCLARTRLAYASV